MLVIPAIDLKSGQVVRLFKGKFDRISRYGDTPEETARSFITAGARRLHLIVLWGAKEGRISSEEQRAVGRVVAVRDSHGRKNCSIQLGGGIRRYAQIEQFLGSGIDYLIMGTALLIPVALESGYSIGDIRKFYNSCGKNFIAEEEVPEFELLDRLDPALRKQIIVAVDYKADETGLSGWQVTLPLLPEYIIARFMERGFTQFLLTNIERDGTLEGVGSPHLTRLLEKLAAFPQRPSLLISGGVQNEADLSLLAQAVLVPDGVVIGKALYQHGLNFRKAVETFQENA